MARHIRSANRPSGLMRWLLRAPIFLFEAGLGPLFGRHLLLLESLGHRTGLPRRTVLEVVHHDSATDTFYVAAGFGPGSDWYGNVRHQPEVLITVGRHHVPVYACPVEPKRAGEILVGYAARHPRTARVLLRWLGFEVDGSEADYREVPASLGLQMIAFVPRRVSQPADRRLNGDGRANSTTG